MPRPGRSIREATTVLAVVGVVAALLWPAARTNCGGNTAALHEAHTYDRLIRWAASRSGGRPQTAESLVRIAATELDCRDDIERISQDHWSDHARFLVAREPFRVDPRNPRGIVVVGERPYRNVPQRTFNPWPNPPTHAAGFADGSTRLISVEEFAALDRTRFTYLDEVLAGIGPTVATKTGR